MGNQVSRLSLALKLAHQRVVEAQRLEETQDELAVVEDNVACSNTEAEDRLYALRLELKYTCR